MKTVIGEMQFQPFAIGKVFFMTLLTKQNPCLCKNDTLTRYMQNISINKRLDVL